MRSAGGRGLDRRRWLVGVPLWRSCRVIAEATTKTRCLPVYSDGAARRSFGSTGLPAHSELLKMELRYGLAETLMVTSFRISRLPFVSPLRIFVAVPPSG